MKNKIFLGINFDKYLYLYEQDDFLIEKEPKMLTSLNNVKGSIFGSFEIMKITAQTTTNITKVVPLRRLVLVSVFKLSIFHAKTAHSLRTICVSGYFCDEDFRFVEYFLVIFCKN